MIRERAILDEHNVQILRYGLEKWCRDARAIEYGSFGVRKPFQIVKSNERSDLFVLDVRKADLQAWILKFN